MRTRHLQSLSVPARAQQGGGTTTEFIDELFIFRVLVAVYALFKEDSPI